MKRILLGTTALIGTTAVIFALDAGHAEASDGIELSLGGFYRTIFIALSDDDSAGERGNDRNGDNFFTDGEVYFQGHTTLDNGLTVGAYVELEAEQEGDQIDESYVFFEGGFGQVRIGNDDSALEGACITPPGLTANFGAFSPHVWATNEPISSAGAIVAPTTNSACIGVDGDSTRIVYFSPTWSGFSFALSYAPDGNSDGGVTHGFTKGGTARGADSAQHTFSAYLTYAYEGDGWGLTWGGGTSFEGRVDDDGIDNEDDADRSDFYQTGLNLTFGDFSIGGVVQLYRDFGTTIDMNADGWVAGGGMAYAMDAWTVGLQYSHLDFENDTPDDNFDVTRDRVVVTANYEMGPGINIDAELGYTWVDVRGADPGSDADAADDYDAFEIGVGTAFDF